MGDKRRFKIVADFVQRNFPPPLAIAGVAGGQGNLSFILAQKGYDCTVIDPRNTGLSKNERRLSRRKGIRFRRARKEFAPEMAAEFDLIIGLHPDEATEAICKAAKTKPVILIPCCRYWRGIESPGSPSMAKTIRKFFQNNKIEWWETLLKMNGKNLVFVTRGGGENVSLAEWQRNKIGPRIYSCLEKVCSTTSQCHQHQADGF